MATKAQGKRNLRVGFQLSIVTLFTALVLAVGLGLIFLSFDRASAIMLSAARQFVDQVSDHVADKVKGEFDPVLNELGILARLPAIDSEQIKDDPQLYALLVAVLRQLPQLYNLYAGYGDGNYLEVDSLSHLPPDRVSAMGAPPDAKFRLVLIEDRPQVGRWQTYRFLDDALVEIGTREQSAAYDPRTRPWYQDAFDASSAPVTPPYVFGVGAIGYTARQSLAGARKGVVAGDILLDETDRFLEQQRLGRTGVAMLFNRVGNVVAHPQLQALIARMQTSSQAAGTVGVALPNLDTAGIPGLTEAVLAWRASGEGAQFFESNGRTFVASFRPVGASIAQGLDLAVVAPLDEFFEEIVRARWQLMLIALAVVAAAVPVALWLGRVLSRSVRELVLETERIQRFDFSRPARITSIIREIDDLGQSVATMKTVVRAFANFVPKSLVQRVVETGASIDLGGGRREVSILFTDIENFTGITEGADAERVMTFTSRYLAVFSDTIMRHHGTVDKFVGDAVMALWNAPNDDADHVAHACEAMLACRIVNRALDPEFAAEGWPAYRTRYGLHVGEAIVGNVGSSDRMNYTALGQTVNLAARLESLNKQFHTEILVSQEVRDRVADRFAFRIVDAVLPKGFASPVPVFELRGTNDNLEEVAFCAAWNELYPLLKVDNPGDALPILNAFAERYPDDPVCQFHLERMQRSFKLRPGAARMRQPT